MNTDPMTTPIPKGRITHKCDTKTARKVTKATEENEKIHWQTWIAPLAWQISGFPAMATSPDLNIERVKQPEHFGQIEMGTLELVKSGVDGVTPRPAKIRFGEIGTSKGTLFER